MDAKDLVIKELDEIVDLFSRACVLGVLTGNEFGAQVLADAGDIVLNLIEQVRNG